MTTIKSGRGFIISLNYVPIKIFIGTEDKAMKEYLKIQHEYMKSVFSTQLLLKQRWSIRECEIVYGN